MSSIVTIIILTSYLHIFDTISPPYGFILRHYMKNQKKVIEKVSGWSLFSWKSFYRIKTSY